MTTKTQATSKQVYITGHDGAPRERTLSHDTTQNTITVPFTLPDGKKILASYIVNNESKLENIVALFHEVPSSKYGKTIGALKEANLISTHKQINEAIDKKVLAMISN